MVPQEVTLTLCGRPGYAPFRGSGDRLTRR
jgi:hypothetical protein